jgi:adenine-specific DNA-methyltransferase
VLEGESGETIGKNRMLFHERALPDLGNNIKCGNSLVGSDFYAQMDLPELTNDDHYRINAFDWKDEFESVFKAGGFDAVIGNPPYGATLYPLEKKFLQKHYVHQSYQLDSYLLFIELSIINLLKKDGMWGMIIPNPWLSNLKQGKLRRLVMGNTRLNSIVHFQYPVFKKVVVDTEVVIFQNGHKKGEKPIVILIPSEPNTELLENSSQIIGSQDDWLSSSDKPINIFLNDIERNLRDKVFSQINVVSDVFNINVGIKPYQKGKGSPAQSKEIVEKRLFDATKKLSPDYRQYLRGKDIGKYEIKPLENRFLKYGVWLAEPRPAANFEAPYKILVRQTGDEIIAALDNSQYLCLNNLHVLVPCKETKNLYGLLALLNSKLMTWCLRTMNPEAGEALAEVKKEFVEMLPIPELTRLDELDKLGKVIYDFKKSNTSELSERQLNMLLKQIDAVVFKLYGLGEDEIALVEKAHL